MNKEAKILFEQDLMKMRVIHTENDEFDIEVAVLEGPSIGVTEPNEFIAKTITQGLLKAYTEGLKELQEKMLDALSKIQDEAKEDVSSEPVKLKDLLHSEDNESEDS